MAPALKNEPRECASAPPYGGKWRWQISRRAAIIAASGRADAIAAHAVQLTKCRAAHSGYARPCHHAEAVEFAMRRGKIAVGNAAGEDVDQIEAEPGGKGLA